MKFLQLRIWALLLACALLTSCGLVNADYETFLSPPAPAGEKEEIQRVLDEYAGGNFAVKYPNNTLSVGVGIICGIVSYTVIVSDNISS